MANTKLDHIERDIEKTRAKILEYQKRLKDLEVQKIEEENAQIVQVVKAVHLDGAQLAAFLSAYASGEIALPQPDADYTDEQEATEDEASVSYTHLYYSVRPCHLRRGSKKPTPRFAEPQRKNVSAYAACLKPCRYQAEIG